MFRQITPGLERYFEFQRLNTNWKTEILAGVTTFITMAYIVFVNPSILKDAGMPVAAVFAATCLSAAFATILMGAFARYPIALAPGMGLNAYFTYTVVKGMGVWAGRVDHYRPSSLYQRIGRHRANRPARLSLLKQRSGLRAKKPDMERSAGSDHQLLDEPQSQPYWQQHQQYLHR